MKHKNSSVILVYNSAGELAVQLRASHDDKYPSHWDFSAAGGIDEGEDHDVAAQRELQEEIGISTPLTFIKEILYKDNKGTDRLFVYKASHEGPFTVQEEEVDDVKFFSREDIEHMISSGEDFHPEFIYLWNEGLLFS